MPVRIISFFLLFLVLNANAQVPERARQTLQQKPSVSNDDSQVSLYEKKWLIREKDTLPYRIMYPEQYDAKKKYPLVLFLHGSGERGRDNEKQLVHGGDLFARADVRENYPAIVVFPQCPEWDRWSNFKFMDSNGHKTFGLVKEPTTSMLLVEALLQDLVSTGSVDEDRIYVGGLSLGGMGTFEIARRNPSLFAAAFPICGAADPSTAHGLRGINWWIFHGAKDDIVPPEFSASMAEALKKEKANVRFTLYPDANHNSWDAAFAEPELLPWMFKKVKSKKVKSYPVNGAG